jgi:hypothetical protein
MLLVSPLVWAFYLIWLLPTFCACFAALGPPGRSGWRMYGAWGALGLLYVTLAYPIALPLRPFATLALWALTGALYWRTTRGAALGMRGRDISASIPLARKPHMQVAYKRLDTPQRLKL